MQKEEKNKQVKPKGAHEVPVNAQAFMKA